jgi:hypothetical protein
MPKPLITLLLLISIGSTAQTIVPQNEKTLIIPVVKPQELSTKANKTLNVSDLIAIKNGDEIKLHPKLESLPPQHQFLKGLFKSVATFTLSFYANKAISNNKGNTSNATASTNITPTLGISLAAGLPNMLHGLKNKRSYLVYTLYDVNKVPLTTQKVLLNKRNKNDYTSYKATADGYLKAAVFSKNKRVIPGDLIISISKPEKVQFKGEIASQFELNSSFDCQSGGDGGGDGGSCEAIFLSASAAALALYVEEMAFCGTLVLPPVIAVCAGIATVGYAGVQILLALNLAECRKKK